MAKQPPNLRIYDLVKVGVNVDTDNIHVPSGAFRSAQNLIPDPTAQQAESLINRQGLVNLNLSALGSGAVLGGIAIPAFASGNGVETLFIGFGD